MIFPRLSRLTAGGQQNQFRDTIRQTIHSSLFFVLPMSVGLMVVARPLISFIYGGGEFDSFATDITSTALVWVSVGMAGYAIQNILSRAYFARQDGRTPLIAGAISIGVNIVLCALLIDRFEVAGLALSSAVSSTVYALLLLLPMEKKGEGVLDRGMVADLVKMIAASLAMGLCAGAVLSALTSILPAGKLGELVCLGLCALAGLIVYFLLVLILGVQEAKLSVTLIKQLRKRG